MRSGPPVLFLAAALATAATAVAAQEVENPTFAPRPTGGARVPPAFGTTNLGLRPGTGPSPTSATFGAAGREPRATASEEPVGTPLATRQPLGSHRPVGPTPLTGAPSATTASPPTSAGGSVYSPASPGEAAPGEASTSGGSGSRGTAARRVIVAKRTRPPTVGVIRAPVRPSLVPPRLRGDDRTRIPVIGVPDPGPPPMTVAPAAVKPVLVGTSISAPEGASGPPPQLRLGAPELRRRLAVEDDPYAPLGIKEGGVVYYPSIGQSVGYDTNPNRVQPKEKGSALLRTDGELKFLSNWSAHELAGELRGGYIQYPNARGADRPDGDGVVKLRLDANRDTQLDFEGRYKIDTQRPGSPDLNAGVTERPTVATFGGSAGVTERFNRFTLGLRGNVDRETYENGRLSNGTIVKQDDRDANQYGVRLRAAYDVSPAFVPFVDLLADTRVHDRAIDYSGYRRDSDGVGVKAGAAFELSRILTAEVSAGTQHRTYADRRLRDLDGPLVDASLAWAVTPITTLRLKAGTSVTETSVQGASGILSQTGGIELQHELRRNLRVTLAGAVVSNDYQGAKIHEEGFSAGIKLDYRITRWLAVRASFSHDNLRSSIPNGGYTANTYLLGLRLNP